jgi:PAT family beta-lactamase induction signal transducer AmpG
MRSAHIGASPRTSARRPRGCRAATMRPRHTIAAMPDPTRTRPSTAPPAGPAEAAPGALAAAARFVVVTLLGFASGLPLALTGQAMQAWLTLEGIDLATIGFLALVGLPYTFKFLWAPLLDRFDAAGRWRRRAWLVATQLALAGALWALAGTSPSGELRAFALLAVAVAFASASQDVVIDAYRTELLRPSERGLGASLNVMGYRLAMILSGGVALIWTDPAQAAAGAGGWTWPEVYRFMAALMAGAAVVSAVLLPTLPPRPGGEGAAAVGAGEARRELLGFAALVAAVVAGWFFTEHAVAPAAKALLAPLLEGGTLPPALQKRWIDLATLLGGIGCTLPLAWFVVRRAGFTTLQSGLSTWFARPAAVAFLVLVVLYKLGDAFAGSLLTPFLLKHMAYASAEVGVVNKVLGLWLTIGGALLGGALMLRIGLWRALLGFGVLQLLSNLGFWWLAVNGKGALPGLVIPAFDWGFVSLATATPVDGGLLAAVAFENITGGMGTAAFVALLMSLCDLRYTATHFALLSAFASIGRVWVGPLAGVLVESIGWPVFFLVSTVVALPGVLMLVALRRRVAALEAPRGPLPAED